MEELFKAYDIRGVYEKELDEGLAYLIGRAFVTVTKAQEVLVGEDMRPSSQPLRDALIKGLVDQGANVVHIGLCSTAMFYYATKEYPAGIMVTASHNPKEYNGFKLCRERATPIGADTGIQDIKELVFNQEFSEPETKGEITTKGFLEEYVTFSKGFLSTTKPFKIVVDAGNGMGGYTYSELQKQLPNNITLTPLFWELDGSFPHHEANPLKEETLKDLQKTVLEEQASFGVALDGDGDRIMFVDEKANPISSALIGALISQYLLRGEEDKAHKNNKILYDLRSSKVFKETVEQEGGVAIESRVGHAFIKHTMRKEDILFGAEVSGHLYHKEVEYAENEIIPFCRVLNILSQEDKPLSELLEPLHKYAHIPETNFVVKDSEEIIAKVRAHYKDSAQKTTTIDGLKMELGNWWFSLRASNTEPLLRLNLEADNKAVLEEKFSELKQLIKE